MLYRLYAYRGDDFDDWQGLTEDQLVEKAADLESQDKYDKYTTIEFCPDWEDWDEQARIAGRIGARAAVRKKEKAAEQVERDRQYKEAQANAGLATRKLQYEALRKEFEGQ